MARLPVANAFAPPPPPPIYDYGFRRRTYARNTETNNGVVNRRYRSRNRQNNIIDPIRKFAGRLKKCAKRAREIAGEVVDAMLTDRVRVRRKS